MVEEIGMVNRLSLISSFPATFVAIPSSHAAAAGSVESGGPGVTKTTPTTTEAVRTISLSAA
jgi:hypothetical protein